MPPWMFLFQIVIHQPFKFKDIQLKPWLELVIFDLDLLSEVK